MPKIVLSFASALLLAACGRPAATSSVVPSQLPPAAAFQCVMKAFQRLGYQRTMYDQEEFRTSAKKENPKITFSNTQFRKTWDRLDVDIGAGASGTDMEIAAVTEAEYFNQTGKSLERLSPSAEVGEAARELESQCDGSVPTHPDSVPPASQ